MWYLHGCGPICLIQVAFLREGNKIVKHSEHLWCESYHEKSFLSYLKLNAEGKRERNNWYQCMLKNTR